MSVAELKPKEDEFQPSPSGGDLLEGLVPKGFEVADFDHSIKLVDPTGELNPSAMKELQELAATFSKGEAAVFFTGYEYAQEVLVNRNSQGKIYADQFVRRGIQKGRRWRRYAFRVESMPSPGPHGVDALVFIKPEAKAREEEKRRKREEAARKERLRLLVGSSAISSEALQH